MDIPINDGTLPDWNVRLGYPQSFNMFVGQSGALYYTPGYETLYAVENIRDFRFTNFGQGSYFTVTNTQVFSVSQGGVPTQIGTIRYSGLPVQIDENQKSQIAFADGSSAYVYDQNTGIFVELNEVDHNFALESPIAVVQLNSYMIFLDANGTWQISDPNNALFYNDGLQVIDAALGKAVGLAVLRNNLFILGSADMERWEPTVVTNTYLFPFQKDTNFRSGFGVISTNSIVPAIDKIYFLSSKFVPMVLTPQGLFDIPKPEQKYQQPPEGIAKLFGTYPDVTRCFGSFYSWFGNYFYHLTFPETNIAWVYNETSNRFSIGDDYFIAAAKEQMVIANAQGLSTLSNTPLYKHRSWRSRRCVLDKGQPATRSLWNGAELRLVQGYSQSREPEYVELSVSKDSEQFLNSVRAPIGLTGQRQNRITWNSNVAFQYEITFKADYYGTFPLTIEKFTANIK